MALAAVWYLTGMGSTADYRNGYCRYHFDATKWTIGRLSKLGLAEHLRPGPIERRLTKRWRLLRGK